MCGQDHPLNEMSATVGKGGIQKSLVTCQMWCKLTLQHNSEYLLCLLYTKVWQPLVKSVCAAHLAFSIGWVNEGLQPLRCGLQRLQGPQGSVTAIRWRCRTPPLSIRCLNNIMQGTSWATLVQGLQLSLVPHRLQGRLAWLRDAGTAPSCRI
jgi:hypothetical protein